MQAHRNSKFLESDSRAAAFAGGNGLIPAFKSIPQGWYYLCRAGALSHGPIAGELGRLRVVAFRDADGCPRVLDARCSHMGADLSRGAVVNGKIRCPLHGWEYGSDGQCIHIPAMKTVPPFACQPAYPAIELGGHVLFHNGPAAPFPMPFFEGMSPQALLPARPFEITVNTGWHMIAANAFDVQHFRLAHDREMIDTPTISSPSPFARGITANYSVTGQSLRDKLTRQFSGSQVEMTVTVWAGVVILVTARFQKTTSYGMVLVHPLGEERTLLRTIVWVARRKNPIARALVDPVDAWMRRRFIWAFVMDDAVRSNGVRYNPATLIEPDRPLRDYFDWLSALSSASP
jgi:nitrite reductase/ring-hydroxylating ferredoxin subunit/uncharacterized protein YlxP (DUF503 family)